jgi:AmmeMemoRadiSam system protein B
MLLTMKNKIHPALLRRTMPRQAMPRPRSLPLGWYPDTAEEVLRYMVSTSSTTAERKAGEQSGTVPVGTVKRKAALAAVAHKTPIGVVVPHPGWTFGVSLDCLALEKLPRDAERVIIAGGHLPEEGLPYIYMEDAAWTPLGDLPLALSLREAFMERWPLSEPQRGADNTCEILFPLVRHFFPTAEVLALRIAPNAEAYRMGQTLAELSRGKKTAFIASTDLTHYGPAYGFQPLGRVPLAEAEAWVRGVNDAGFLEALKRKDTQGLLDWGEGRGAACSTGAVLAALGFADRLRPAWEAEVLAHSSSNQVSPGSASFVGFAAVCLG